METLGPKPLISPLKGAKGFTGRVLPLLGACEIFTFGIIAVQNPGHVMFCARGTVKHLASVGAYSETLTVPAHGR